MTKVILANDFNVKWLLHAMKKLSKPTCTSSNTLENFDRHYQALSEILLTGESLTSGHFKMRSLLIYLM